MRPTFIVLVFEAQVFVFGFGAQGKRMIMQKKQTSRAALAETGGDCWVECPERRVQSRPADNRAVAGIFWGR